MSAFTHSLLSYVGPPAVLLAIGVFAWRVSRAVLLYRAGSAGLKHGIKDPRGEAGLKIVDALTGADEPRYRAILGRKSGEDQP
jgi:hypothetical protein